MSVPTGMSRLSFRTLHPSFTNLFSSRTSLISSLVPPSAHCYISVSHSLSLFFNKGGIGVNLVVHYLQTWWIINQHTPMADPQSEIFTHFCLLHPLDWHVIKKVSVKKRCCYCCSEWVCLFLNVFLSTLTVTRTILFKFVRFISRQGLYQNLNCDKILHLEMNNSTSTYYTFIFLLNKN